LSEVCEFAGGLEALEEQDFALRPKRMLFERSEFVLFGLVFSKMLALLAILPPKP